jgi:hypothetical protein
MFLWQKDEGEEQDGDKTSKTKSKTKKSGVLDEEMYCYFSAVVEDDESLHQFLSDLPTELKDAVQKPQEDIEAPQVKTKQQMEVQEQLLVYGNQAADYVFGNYNLPTQSFTKPKAVLANREYNPEHTNDLVAHWSAVGLLFPEKLAVGCVFEV